MCLIIKNHQKGVSPIRIAEKDIRVYKVITHGIASCYTPYQGTEIESPIMEAKSFSFSGFQNEQVNKGIHSFSNIERAKHVARCGGRRVHKAIIPKGTKYIEGELDMVSLVLIIGEPVV